MKKRRILSTFLALILVFLTALIPQEKVEAFKIGDFKFTDFTYSGVKGDYFRSESYPGADIEDGIYKVVLINASGKVFYAFSMEIKGESSQGKLSPLEETIPAGTYTEGLYQDGELKYDTGVSKTFVTDGVVFGISVRENDPYVYAKSNDTGLNANTYPTLYGLSGNPLTAFDAYGSTTQGGVVNHYYRLKILDTSEVVFGGYVFYRVAGDVKLRIHKLDDPGLSWDHISRSTATLPNFTNSTNIAPEVGTITTDPKTGIKIKVIDTDNKEVSFTEPKSKSAKTVNIPETVKINDVTYKVTKVEDSAFEGNKKIENVTLSKNIKAIGKNAFNGASKLKSVNIPSKVTTIGSNAFKNCGKLTRVSLPTKTTKIGSYTFSGCKKLKTITIKSTKLTEKTVSKNAFKGLSKTTTIKVPKSKVNTYRKLFKSKGLSSKVKVKVK